MSIKFAYALLSYLLIYQYYHLMLRLVCTSISTSLPPGTGKRQLGVGRHTLVSGAQNTGLSNYKLKSTEKCAV